MKKLFLATAMMFVAGTASASTFEDYGKNWTVHSNVNRVTDQTDVNAYLWSFSINKNNNTRRYSPGITLNVRCENNKTEVYISVDEILNSNVIIRFDNERPRYQNWGEATDYRGIFAPSPISLLREMTKYDEMWVQLTYYFYGNEIPIAFDLKNVKQDLQVVADACHWEW